MIMRFASIVFVLVALVTSPAAQQRPDVLAPDAIFVNGKILTVDARSTIQGAFAVKGDTFVAVGTDQRIRALAGQSTRVIDLHRRTVIPGLADNHNHLYESAKIMLRGVSLDGVTSVPQALERISQAVAKARPGETVYTTALRVSLAERARLTIRELDRISTTVPVVVIRGRFNSAVLNTAALGLAGITRDTTSFADVPVPKDQNGDPTGVIPLAGLTAASLRAGELLLDKVLPPLTDEEEEQFLITAMHQRNKLGLTSIRDLNVSPRAARAYVRLWRKGLLTVRVSMGILAWDSEQLAMTLSNSPAGSGYGDAWLRLDSISEFPLPVQDDAQAFAAASIAAAQFGWRLSPHLGAPNSLNVALDGFEAADSAYPIRDKRWVLEHVPIATPLQLDRMAHLGLVISEQTAESAAPPPMRDLFNHHLIVSAGSDFLGGPTSTDNPFFPIHFYVTRLAANGQVVGPEQKISREDALRASTYNYAYTTFEEKIKGSIEPGKLADFLILSDDLLTIPEENILSLHPLATYIGGRKVFQMDGVNF
jgi:predicted amidohydrolase YtcJ